MTLRYPLSSIIDGIDVQKYQGNINYSSVASQDKKFVFVRLGYANSDGSLVIDPYFERNVSGFINAGLDVGVYIYSYINSVDAAILCATHVLELVADYKLGMPIAFDVEHASIYSQLGRSVTTDICNAFSNTIYKAGFLPIIYTYKSFFDSYIDSQKLNKYEGLWVANYTGTIGVDDTAIWQYSSSGSVPGVPGRCDLNHMYFDIPRIIREDFTPGNIEWAPVSNKVLEVIKSGRCEYFTSPSIYDTVPNPSGVGTDKLPVGEYDVIALADGLIDGFTFVKIKYNGSEVYVAVLDDRCHITNKVVPTANVTMTPYPSSGDRASIIKFCKSLGIDVVFNE